MCLLAYMSVFIVMGYIFKLFCQQHCTDGQAEKQKPRKVEMPAELDEYDPQKIVGRLCFFFFFFFFFLRSPAISLGFTTFG